MDVYSLPDLYYGGEAFSVEQPQAFTCPYCGRMGYTEMSLQEHVAAEHTETSTEVVSWCSMKFKLDVCADINSCISVNIILTKQTKSVSEWASHYRILSGLSACFHAFMSYLLSWFTVLLLKVLESVSESEIRIKLQVMVDFAALFIAYSFCNDNENTTTTGLYG